MKCATAMDYVCKSLNDIADVVSEKCWYLDEQRLRFIAERLKEHYPTAHWVWNPDGLDWGLGAWQCSNCRHNNLNLPTASNTLNPYRFAGSHFCPTCGLLMQPEVKHGDNL